MANLTSRGGANPHERLPFDWFDSLSASMWRLGNLSMASALENPNAPSVVRGRPIEHDGLAVELAFTFKLNQLGTPQPIVYRGTLSQIDNVEGGDVISIWSWTTFTLDAIKRKGTFDRGTTVDYPEYEIDVLDSPRPGRKSKAWQGALSLEQACYLEDYENFLAGLDFIHNSIASS